MSGLKRIGNLAKGLLRDALSKDDASDLNESELKDALNEIRNSNPRRGAESSIENNDLSREIPPSPSDESEKTPENSEGDTPIFRKPL